MKTDVIINRDALCALRELPDESVHCCVTSSGLRCRLLRSWSRGLDSGSRGGLGGRRLHLGHPAVHGDQLAAERTLILLFW